MREIKAPRIVNTVNWMESAIEWVFDGKWENYDKEETSLGWALMVTMLFIMWSLIMFWWIAPLRMMTTKVVFKR